MARKGTGAKEREEHGTAHRAAPVSSLQVTGENISSKVGIQERRKTLSGSCFPTPWRGMVKKKKLLPLYKQHPQVTRTVGLQGHF